MVVVVVKLYFIQKQLQWGERDLSIELGSIPKQHAQVGISSQGWRSGGGKLLKGLLTLSTRVRGISAQSDLIELLLKASQGDHISPGGSWGMWNFLY